MTTRQRVYLVVLLAMAAWLFLLAVLIGGSAALVRPEKVSSETTTP